MSLTPEIIQKLVELSPQDRDLALSTLEKELESRAPSEERPEIEAPVTGQGKQ